MKWCFFRMGVSLLVLVAVQSIGSAASEENVLENQRITPAGIEIPLDGNLSAQSGTLKVVFTLPEKWPTSTRGTLFHVGEAAHQHVTLFTNSGRLTAVYKGGEPHYAAINLPQSVAWSGGSRHEVAFSWTGRGEDVDFYLQVDGRLEGRQTGKLIEDWPETGYIGVRKNRQPWQGTIEYLSAEPVFEAPLELQPGERTVHIAGDAVEQPLYNFWSINNYTSQHMWEDPNYAEQAKRDKPFMRQVNCIRLMGGRHDGLNNWFKGVGKDGEVVCDFSGMIRYLRGIQNAGYTPRIVLDNIPTAMSEPAELAKYGNTLPAKDLKVWHTYVKKAVQSMVDAFGSQTVSSWRIRVGTEPDLYPGHWKGTREEYLQHYDCTVDAVLSVLPEAEIGPGNILNPAKRDPVKGTGQPPWGLDIVDHCARGTNTWTGGQGTPIHFLECSWYGQVGRSIDSIDVAVQRMRNRLARYPELANLPISISEFSILNDENNIRCYGDITEWGASWYAAVADRVYDLGIDQVHEWAQATSGILHPRTHVIGMLERMVNGQSLPVAVTGATSMANAGAIACRKDESFYVLLYNHRPWRTPSLPEEISLVIESDTFRMGPWGMTEWRIDHNNGVFAWQFYEDCEAAGLQALPKAPLYGGNVRLKYGAEAGAVLAGNREVYEELGKPVPLRGNEPVTVTGKSIHLDLEMPGHSVSLLEIFPLKE